MFLIQNYFRKKKKTERKITHFDVATPIDRTLKVSCVLVRVGVNDSTWLKYLQSTGQRAMTEEDRGGWSLAFGRRGQGHPCCCLHVDPTWRTAFLDGLRA